MKNLKWTMHNDKCNGFTLVELLVCIAIICVLFALLFPVITGAVEWAKRAACLSNLRNVAVGMYSYTQDYAGLIPVTPPNNMWNDDMRSLYPEYVQELDVFVCPSTLNYVQNKNDLRNNAPHKGRCIGTSYEYMPWCLKHIMALPGDHHRRRISDSYAVLISILHDIDDRQRNHILDPIDNHGTKGGNMLFLDLHAQWIPVHPSNPRKFKGVVFAVDAYRHEGQGIAFPFQ